jgi:hypothetical protein
MAKQKITREQYTLQRVSNMLRWLLTSGIITYFLIQVGDWITGSSLSPELATALLILVNTSLFAVRTYVEGE